MRKLSVLAAVSLVLGMTSAAGAMTADELIAKNIETSGGLEKLRSIQTRKATGKILMGGMEFPFTVQQKRPNLMRIDSSIQGMSYVQVFDGQTAWAINPMTGSQDPQPLPEIQATDLKFEADFDGFLVDYQQKGYSVELAGTDDVEGTEVYHLKLDTHDDRVLDLYFDTDYFLLIKSTTKVSHEETEYTVDTYYSDFQEVDGTKVPFAIETKSGDQTVNQIMIDSLEYNVAVDDSIFPMPAKTKTSTSSEGE